MNQAIIDFVQSKRIVIVGASRSDKKFGNLVSKELKGRGYQVLIVHPEAQEIGGDSCYPNLAAVAGKADAVFVSVTPSRAEQVVREAAQAGFTKIWLQQGAESPEALAAAREVGVTLVTGKCILMYAPPVTSIHGWHRAFAKLFGQL